MSNEVHTINNHKINITLVDGNKVKLNIINPINVEYESITHISDLKSPFGYQYTYYIILECFKKNPNYIFTTAFKDDVYYLKFQFIHMIYEVLFSIKVQRKVIATMSDLENTKKEFLSKIKDFDCIKHKYETDIDILKKELALVKDNLKKAKYNNQYEIDQFKNMVIERNIFKDIIDDLDEKDIYIKFTKVIYGKQSSFCFTYVPLLSNDVTLCNVSDLHKVKSLFKLEKLNVSTNNMILNFGNKYVKTLILNAPMIETLNGIENFPNLEVLELVACNKLYDIKTFLVNCKIKKVIFKKCGDSQKRNMISFCNAKKIELIFE